MPIDNQLISNITDIALQCGILAIAFYLYILLVCRIYPWTTMNLMWYGKMKHMPRGVRKVVFDGGRGVVYEPALYIRKYISKYAIFLHNGSKFVRCEINPNIKKMKYDIVSFNAKRKILDVMCVKERISNAGETQAVALPTDTAYAIIIPRKIDKAYSGKEKVVGYSWGGIIVLFVLTVATTIAMAFVLNYAFTTLANIGIPNYQPAPIAAVLLRGALCGVAVNAITLLAYFLHSIRVINK